ncbi:MAG: hypothetical protein CM15mP18_4090 [Methanobacteriota archaeon]|nr:MAG: hypothetical protein CM15mP18_4090 [Euryarchaeota archaeon]
MGQQTHPPEEEEGPPPMPFSGCEKSSPADVFEVPQGFSVGAPGLFGPLGPHQFSDGKNPAPVNTIATPKASAAA